MIFKLIVNLIVLQESPEPLDEPCCIKGDLSDPVGKPDRYVFPNGDEVHMCAGEVITREELQQLYLNLINFFVSWTSCQSKQNNPYLHLAGVGGDPHQTTVPQRRGASQLKDLQAFQSMAHWLLLAFHHAGILFWWALTSKLPRMPKRPGFFGKFHCWISCWRKELHNLNVTIGSCYCWSCLLLFGIDKSHFPQTTSVSGQELVRQEPPVHVLVEGAIA